MRRNILMFIADDLGRMLGCYGESAVRTPNIDALAEQGIRFDNAFTSTASCSGSRSVIYTGLHTHQNGMYGLHHDHHHFMTYDSIATAPARFNELGYRTGIVGKVHVGPEAVYPWQFRQESGTRDVNQVTAWAADFLPSSAAQDKPFFLTIGFIDPHRDATRGGFGNEIECAGLAQDSFDPASVSVPGFLPDLPEVRQEFAAYYRSIQRMDHGVGQVMQILEQRDLLDSTLVLFLSDNGAPFVNSKTTLYDAGIHLPLIIRSPTHERGIVNPNLVSYVDLLPTLLEYAGSSPKADAAWAGRSILPILDQCEAQDDWQRVFGSHTFHEITNYYPTRFIRTPRYKYHRNVAWQLDFPFSADNYGSLSWQGIRNTETPMLGPRSLKAYIRRPPEELYDLVDDPQEVRNLADDPEHRERLLAFRADMMQWQRETDDPWLYQDGVSLRAIRNHIEDGLQVPERFDMDVDAPGNAE